MVRRSYLWFAIFFTLFALIMLFALVQSLHAETLAAPILSNGGGAAIQGACWAGLVKSYYYVPGAGWRVYIEAVVGKRAYAAFTVRRFHKGQSVQVCRVAGKTLVY